MWIAFDPHAGSGEDDMPVDKEEDVSEAEGEDGEIKSGGGGRVRQLSPPRR